jgi:hypothetical protein
VAVSSVSSAAPGRIRKRGGRLRRGPSVILPPPFSFR